MGGGPQAALGQKPLHEALAAAAARVGEATRTASALPRARTSAVTSTIVRTKASSCAHSCTPLRLTAATALMPSATSWISGCEASSAASASKAQRHSQ